MTHTPGTRIALVTGGTGALGKAVVAGFVDAGFDVHVSWMVQQELDGLRTTLGPAADALHVHQADVSDPAAVRQLIDEVTRDHGRVDVLANLVGGFARAPLGETDPEVWLKMLTLNATTAFLCCRYAAPHMHGRGWGRIINVVAVPAVERGAANMSAYAASKAAVLNLTQSLSKELVGDGITVNAIVPSTIDTPANRAAMPDVDTSAWLEPAAIAEVVLWLAGESAGIVTGTAVMLSRG